MPAYLSIWRESDRVHRVRMSSESANLHARCCVPQSDDRVQRASREQSAVGREGDARESCVDRSSVSLDEVLDLEVKHARPGLDVPDPSRLVSRARDNVSAVGGEVERVDLLGVTLKEMLDPLLLDVPNLMQKISESVRCRWFTDTVAELMALTLI